MPCSPCPAPEAVGQRRRTWLLALGAGLALGGCATQRRVPAPDIVTVQDWGGQATPAPAQPQRLHQLTLHHGGVDWPLDKPVPDYLRRLQRWSRQTQGWPDIPYHYIVAPDGLIYAARPEGLAGDTNTEYDPQGHGLVMLLGNFEHQQPTPAQLHATVKLLAWMAQTQGLGVDAIAAHRDFSRQTVCPGRHLAAYLDSGWLRLAVQARLAGQPGPALP